VYARPEYIDTLATSTPIASHVKVDYELRGCPVDKNQLLEVLSALLHGRKPAVAAHSVCVECKLRGNVCVMVAHGTACLGPVTHAGCGALCPSFHRGCYGCFGPAETTNTKGLEPALVLSGKSPEDIARLYSTFNAAAPEFERGRQEQLVKLRTKEGARG
jgi:sulfhydrogenase subunit delta